MEIISENFFCKRNDYDLVKIQDIKKTDNLEKGNYINVFSQLDSPETLIVENHHEENYPKRYIEGVNMWSNGECTNVGFWRVKFKNK